MKIHTVVVVAKSGVITGDKDRVTIASAEKKNKRKI